MSWQDRDAGTGTVPIEVWWPENQKSQCFYCSPIASHSRPKKSQHFSWSPKPGLTSSLLKGGLAFLFIPSTGWMRPTTSGSTVCFIQMLISSRNPHRHIQNNVWPNISAPHSPVKLTYKMNHHNFLFFFSSQLSSHPLMLQLDSVT